MQDIPKAITTLFLERLQMSNIPASYHAEYLQWLRYYLDFAARYPMPDSRAERVRIFCEKLAMKNRTADQQRRAAHAVSLYFAIVKNELQTKARSDTDTAGTEQPSIPGTSYMM